MSVRVTIPLKPRPGAGTALLLPHSVNQSKLQDQPRSKEKRNKLHFLMGLVIYTIALGGIIGGHLCKQFPTDRTMPGMEEPSVNSSHGPS